MRMRIPGRLAAALAVLWLAAPVRAEVDELRITRQPSIIYLPMVLMERQRLVETHAARMGLPELKTSWLTFTSGGASTEALISGNVDLVTSGVTNLALLWDRTRGAVKGVAAAAGLPMLLVTRNPKVRTLKDFGETDRIAVPTIRVSSQAIMLQMALEQAYGPDGIRRLDAQLVQLGHPEAMQALSHPGHEVNSHYSAPPYQSRELKLPGVHAVLDSSETMGGPVTNAVVFAAAKFHDANPKAIAAFLAALDEANGFIAADKRQAAEIYLAATKERFTPDEIVEMLEQPNVVFSSTPQGTMKLVAFMARTGLIKQAPAGWKDLFFPELHGRPGS